MICTQANRLRAINHSTQGIHMIRSTPAQLATAAIVAMSAWTAAQAQVTTDAGSVGVRADDGSYAATSSDGSFGSSSIPAYTASVITNGIEFQPTVGVGALSNSAYNYHDGNSLMLSLNGLFVPEAGVRLQGFTVTVNGTVQASGSGVANLSAGMSFAGVQASGGNTTTTWQNTGASQAFSFVRTFSINPALASSSDWTLDVASLSISGGVSSHWSPPACYYGVFCSAEVSGSAALQVTDVTWQAVVASAAPVPEANGLWVALTGGLGLLWAGRRARHQA
jgi:hypothetical protein